MTALPQVSVIFPDGEREVAGFWRPDGTMYAGGIGELVLEPFLPDWWVERGIGPDGKRTWIARPKDEKPEPASFKPIEPEQPISAFDQRLDRLRHLASHRQPGVARDRCLVDRRDLAALLEDFDRIDRAYRLLYAEAAERDG